LYDNIYIDNIQKAVICLINPTTFPFEAESSKIIHFPDVTLDPASKGNVVGMIRQMNIIDEILSYKSVGYQSETRIACGGHVY
jgi:hypothetical protein